MNIETKLEEKVANVQPPSVARTPYPAWALSTFFLASSAIPPAKAARIPPFYQRFGFGLIFAGAGYVLSTGDVYNGSGIATDMPHFTCTPLIPVLTLNPLLAWSLTYLLVNLRKSVTTLRSPLNLAMSAGAFATATLYGTEYFGQGSQEIKDDE